MAKIIVTKQINAPPEKVFELATDFGQLAQRVRGIDKVEVLTEGPTQLGTRFRETRTMMGKEATEEMEVTAIDPPHSYCLEAESCGCHYVSWHHFTPLGGGVEVRMEINGRPLTFLGKLMMPLTFLFAGSLKKMISADLDDLKAAAEG